MHIINIKNGMQSGIGITHSFFIWSLAIPSVFFLLIYSVKGFAVDDPNQLPVYILILSYFAIVALQVMDITNPAKVQQLGRVKVLMEEFDEIDRYVNQVIDSGRKLTIAEYTEIRSFANSATDTKTQLENQEIEARFYKKNPK